MKQLDTVAIVGVGLIGGSIGLALRQRNLAKNVVGIGRQQAILRVARRVGAITHTTIDLNKGVAEADLVVVCTPAGRIVEHVRQAAQHCPERTLLTDVGSAKQAIVEALDGGLARGCRFLGGHPLAGSEKTGANNASADLFEGRVAILTPTKNTRAEDFDLLEEFWQSLGVGGRADAARGARPGVGPDEPSAARRRGRVGPGGAGEILPPLRLGHLGNDPPGGRQSRSFGARFSCSIATTC